MMKMINGNMKGINKLNFFQYNKSNSKYETKELFFNRVIFENNIDVACICEAIVDTPEEPLQVHVVVLVLPGGSRYIEQSVH